MSERNETEESLLQEFEAKLQELKDFLDTLDPWKRFAAMAYLQIEIEDSDCGPFDLTREPDGTVTAHYPRLEDRSRVL